MDSRLSIISKPISLKITLTNLHALKQEQLIVSRHRHWPSGLLVILTCLDILQMITIAILHRPVFHTSPFLIMKKNLPAVPVKEDYDHIEQDLKNAATLMTNMDRDINDGDSRAYIDADAVNAMLARMYLYSNQLDDAVQYATLAIDARPLADISEFPIYGLMVLIVRCCGLAYLKQARDHRDQMFIFLLHHHQRAGASTNLIQHWFLLTTRQTMCAILPTSKIFPGDWFYQNTSQRGSTGKSRRCCKFQSIPYR